MLMLDADRKEKTHPQNPRKLFEWISESGSNKQGYLGFLNQFSGLKWKFSLLYIYRNFARIHGRVQASHSRSSVS